MDVGELMLLLKRKRNEKIRLTDKDTGVEIVITITDLNKNSVRLGFDAPANIQILRTELDNNSENSEGKTISS